jgi:hypothetical protein
MTSSWDSDELTSFHALARSGLTSRLTFVITEGRWAERHVTAMPADTHTRLARIRVPLPQSW